MVQVREAQLGSFGDHPEALSVQPCCLAKSKWILRKHKTIGKLLEVTYEGCEDAISDMLRDIEARYLARKANTPCRQPAGAGPKCAWELRGLVSLINYDARGSRLFRVGLENVLVVWGDLELSQ